MNGLPDWRPRRVLRCKWLRYNPGMLRGEDTTKRWRVGLRDILVLTAGVCVSLSLARWALVVFNGHSHRAKSELVWPVAIYCLGLFTCGGSIGVFLQRLSNGRRSHFLLPFLIGGVLCVALRCILSWLGVIGPW